MKDDNPRVALWLDISAALLRDLVSDVQAVADKVGALDGAANAALVSAETARVDHALVAIATADDGEQARFISRQLSAETVMALTSRWALYTGQWRQMLGQPNPHLWVPPTQVWRAVLLAMTTEGIHSTSAASQLWPEHFSAGRG